MWSNRWSTMPIHAYPKLRMPRPDQRAVLDRVPGSDVPVIRQPFAADDPVPFWASRPGSRRHELYDLAEDPFETHDLSGSPAEAEMADMLRTALAALEAPGDQFERLAL